VSKPAACIATLLLCVAQLGMSIANAQTPAAGGPRDGTIKAVQGSVTVVRDNVSTAAVVGGAVHSSDRIQTGEASATAITLMDGTVLSIGPSSEVELSAFQFNPTTNEGNILVRTLRGTLRMVTGLIAKLKPEQVKVTTPTAVIGVRGTDFIVDVHP